jgi:hypothetical protein
MKKTILYIKRCIATLFVCVTAITVQAQVGEPRTDFAIGFNGGAVMSTQDFNPKVATKFKQGMTGGVTLRYTSEKYFSMVCALQAEINYTQLGWGEDFEDVDASYERTLNYVQIPFFARLGWGKEQRGGMFYFLAGPTIGFFLNESTKTYGDVTQLSGHQEQHDMPVEKKFDYGITAGLGFELNTKVGHFGIDARYYYGLADIYGNSKKDTFGRSANSGIMAKLTYLIDIKKTK